MQGEGHVCVLPFDSDDPVFSRGFEAGRIWQLLHQDVDDEVDVIAHAANAEMFLRMAEATGRAVRSEELGDDWISVVFGPAEEAEQCVPND